MGGTKTTGEMLQMTTTGATRNCIDDQWPWNGYPSNGLYTPSVYYYHTVEPPKECAGDVHVFPCPHCEKCKCGKASVKRDIKKATR